MLWKVPIHAACIDACMVFSMRFLMVFAALLVNVTAKMRDSGT